MKLMLKKTTAIILCLMMMSAAFAGCSGNSKETSSMTDSAITSGDTDDVSGEDATSEATDESGVESTADGTESGGQSTANNASKSNNNTNTNSKANANTSTSGNNTGTKFDIATAPMPTRNLSNKKIVYYSWAKLEDEFGKTSKSLPNLLKKEFGITFESKFGTHDSYWDTLAKLKASGQAPDIVKLPNWNFYPRPITEKLIQPLDDIIDFSNPMWDDTKTIRNNNKWNGKTYVGFISEQLQTWFYYNKKMFKDYGLSNKTPLDYYNNNDWTWARMQELADKFVKKDASGNVTQWGVTFQTCDLLASTGLELVQGDGKGGYKFNIKDAKIAKMMNMFYEMGKGGTGSLYGDDAVTGFKNGKVAMIGTNAGLLYDKSGFNEMRRNGTLGWVPLPKMDSSSSYYNQTSFNPGYGIAVGAKNKEGAALFIEFHKWMNLGYSFCPGVPQAKKNAAQTKYNISLEGDDATVKLSDADIKLCNTFVGKNYKNVTIMWQSWLQEMQVPGYGYVLSGAKKWSAALEEVYPVSNAILESYKE